MILIITSLIPGHHIVRQPTSASSLLWQRVSLLWYTELLNPCEIIQSSIFFILKLRRPWSEQIPDRSCQDSHSHSTELEFTGFHPMAFYPGIVGTKIQPKDFLHSFPSNHLNFVLYAIVKLRSRSRSGEGQVRVRQVRVSQSPAQRTQNSKIWTWAVTYFWFSPPPTTHHHTNFFLGC